MEITVPQLFATPDFFLFAFKGDQALFMQMDREAYHRSIFLDGRIVPLKPAHIPVPAQALANWQANRGGPIARKGWIFHVANCGSTLLARALDRIQDDLVLREPMALRQLGVDRARMSPGAMSLWDARLRMTAAQLGKRYRADGPVIVKANVPVNFILPQLMALDAQAPGVLLYYPLRQYLLAILRSDDHRQWVMRVTDELRPSLLPIVGDVAALDPVERAAALWLAQLRMFADALGRYPGLHSLDAATFFGDPRASLTAAAALFGVALTPFQLDATLGSTLFKTYAKDPSRQFGEAERRAREAALETEMAADLVRGQRWVEARAVGLRLPERLARPLAGESPALL